MKPTIGLIGLIILVALSPSLASAQRHSSIPSDAITYTMDRARALAVHKGDALTAADLLPYVEGADVTGRIAVVIRGEVTFDKLRDAIEMSGVVAGRRKVVETCFGSKAQNCSVSHAPAKLH